ncbi:MAG: alpha/beta hydrolase [Actinomycetia bacterium]|nr:alpha/beta hydrolase [Actinomycetes bacterium]
MNAIARPMKPFERPDGAGAPPFPFQPEKADVSHIRRKWLDIPYASVSAAQQLDLYLPDAGEGPFPVVVDIHGGGFELGDKRDPHILAFLRGLERGYAVASLNYRLSGEATFPAGLQDVKAAIRWLRAHAAEYHLEPSRIAACGASAGGNYAAMVCVTGGVPVFDDPSLGNIGYPCDVQAAIDWFGPIDFLTMDEQLAASGLEPCDHSRPESPESRYLGAPVMEVPERARLASPMTYVGNDMPPILIQHGTADNLVPFQQSVEFARAIEERAGRDKCELDLFEGWGHDDPRFSSDENLARVFDFIGRHLK